MNKTPFDRFLKELREPVPQEQIERATLRVLESLDSGEPPRLSTVRLLEREHRLAWRWKGVVAGIAAMVVAGVLQFALVPVPRNEALARTLNGKTYRQGEAIRARNEAMHLLLTDGSRIEMSPRSALSITKTAGGMRIFLEEGDVIVTAAEQRTGRLLVETKDCEISVVGTVFSVSAGPKGSRVSVVEGEVQVRQGGTTHTLLPGEQVVVSLLEQAAPAPQALPVDEPGTVRGVITRNGEGVPEAAISICEDLEAMLSENGRVTVDFLRVFNTAARCETFGAPRTDESGRFLLKNLPPGRYVVRAQKPGYVAALESSMATLGVIVSTRSADQWTYEGGPILATQAIVVGTEPLAVNVSMALVRPGKLSGKVLNRDRELAGYAPVQLGVASGAGEFKRLASVNTNASGEYRFRVPPGEYLVFAGSIGKQNTIPVPSTDVFRVSVKEGEEVVAETINQQK